MRCGWNASTAATCSTAPRCRRWLAAYETLLRGAAANPDGALGELPLLDAAGGGELEALQPAPTPFDETLCAHELFEPSATARRAAWPCAHGTDALSYAELDARANRIAHLLRAHGVRRGALVGIAMERGSDMLAALLGVLKSGAGYVPLDPAFPERPARLHGRAMPAWPRCSTSATHAARFDLRGRPVLALERLADELAAQPAHRPACRRRRGRRSNHRPT